MAIILNANTNYKREFLKKGINLDKKKIPADVIKRWISNGIAIKVEEKEEDKK